MAWTWACDPSEVCDIQFANSDIQIIYIHSSLCTYYIHTVIKSQTLTRWFLTLTMTNMWHPQPELSAPFAFPSWTISTLTAFYLIFPIIISSLNQLTSYKLNMLINILFLSQVIVNCRCQHYD